MAVMVREAWTDQRLDDLNERVASIERRMEAGFAEMRAEFKSVREKLDAGFKEGRTAMDAGFKEAQAESVSIRQDMANQFAAQNRMMIQLAGGMFGTMIVGFLGTIATIITQT
jgi:hypothetical protein